MDSFVQDARNRIVKIKMPTGNYVGFSGTAAAQAQSRHDLMANSLLAGLGIILLLSMVMGNGRNLLLVLTNLPFALVGGVIAAGLSGGDLSLGSLVGFVTMLTRRRLIRWIDEYGADAVVTTYPLASLSLGRAREKGLCVGVGYQPNGRHNVKTALKFLPGIIDWLRERLETYDPH